MTDPASEIRAYSDDECDELAELLDLPAQVLRAYRDACGGYAPEGIVPDDSASSQAAAGSQHAARSAARAPIDLREGGDDEGGERDPAAVERDLRREGIYVGSPNSTGAEESARVIDTGGSPSALRWYELACPVRCPEGVRDMPGSSWWPYNCANPDVYPWLPQGGGANQLAYPHAYGERPSSPRVLRDGEALARDDHVCTSYVTKDVTLLRGYMVRIVGTTYGAGGKLKFNHCSAKLQLPHDTPTTLHKAEQGFDCYERVNLFAGDELFDEPSDGRSGRPYPLRPPVPPDQVWVLTFGYEVHKGVPRMRIVAWCRFQAKDRGASSPECRPNANLMLGFVAARDRWLSSHAPPLLRQWVQERCRSRIGAEGLPRRAAWRWSFMMQPTCNHARVCGHGVLGECADCVDAACA
eukprot:gene4879-14538_t